MLVENVQKQIITCKFFFPIFLCDLLVMCSQLVATQSLMHISSVLKIICRASLVAQWLRVWLPMQGTRVRALVWEDPTCRGATGPVSHNY